MADEETGREGAVDEPQQEPAPIAEPREVKEPDNERWWENPGPAGEVQ